MAHKFNGGLPYHEWLKTLTPEEYQQHLLDRKVKKTIKEAHKQAVDHYKEEITATFMNLGFELLKDAYDKKDAQAYAILFDRLIGKPDQQIDINADKMILPWQDFDEEDNDVS